MSTGRELDHSKQSTLAIVWIARGTTIELEFQTSHRQKIKKETSNKSPSQQTTFRKQVVWKHFTSQDKNSHDDNRYKVPSSSTELTAGEECDCPIERSDWFSAFWMPPFSTVPSFEM
jgi:hypothetical protein